MSISFMFQKQQSHRHLCPWFILYHCSFKIGTVFHTETSLSNGFCTFHTISMASSSYTVLSQSVLSACPHRRSLARKALPTPDTDPRQLSDILPHTLYWIMLLFRLRVISSAFSISLHSIRYALPSK